ncbi:hypothetical protein [Mobiluncus curtisii]|nr:hypothetical protein [Mobiluncus curtisii]
MSRTFGRMGLWSSLLWSCETKPRLVGRGATDRICSDMVVKI